MVELWVLHIISLRWTFDQSLMKILPGIKEILSGQEIQGSIPWPSTVTLTLSLHGWVMGSAHPLTSDQCLMKIFQRVQEIWSWHEIKGSNLWPSPVTLTLSLHGWVMGSAHRLTEMNIWSKFNENLSRGSGDMEKTRKCYGQLDGQTDGRTDGRRPFL